MKRIEYRIVVQFDDHSDWPTSAKLDGFYEDPEEPSLSEVTEALEDAMGHFGMTIEGVSKVST